MSDPVDFPFFIRKWINSVELLFQEKPKLAGVHPSRTERPVTDGELEDVEELPSHFDNVTGYLATKYRKPFYKHSSGKMLKFKGRPKPLSIERKSHIGCHITAVEFGVSSRRVKFWTQQIENGNIPIAVVDLYTHAKNGITSLDDLLEDDIEEAARRMALHERFWKVPYHVVGLINGDVLLNNKLTSYTYHGNGLNDEAIGLSAEANLPGLISQRKPKHTKVTEHWVETQRQAFTVAYERAMTMGAPLVGVRCHRQSSNSRTGDPGEAYYKHVATPMAEKYKLELDVFFVDRRGGKEICIEWDERGQVNYRGGKVNK